MLMMVIVVMTMTRVFWCCWVALLLSSCRTLFRLICCSLILFIYILWNNALLYSHMGHIERRVPHMCGPVFTIVFRCYMVRRLSDSTSCTEQGYPCLWNHYFTMPMFWERISLLHSWIIICDFRALVRSHPPISLCLSLSLSLSLSPSSSPPSSSPAPSPLHLSLSLSPLHEHLGLLLWRCPILVWYSFLLIYFRCSTNSPFSSWEQHACGALC